MASQAHNSLREIFCNIFLGSRHHVSLKLHHPSNIENNSHALGHHAETMIVSSRHHLRLKFRHPPNVKFIFCKMCLHICHRLRFVQAGAANWRRCNSRGLHSVGYVLRGSYSQPGCGSTGRCCSPTRESTAFWFLDVLNFLNSL